MKKIVLALIVVLMGTIAVNAQPRRANMSPEQILKLRVDRLDKALTLTEEQKAEITKIYSEEMESVEKDNAAINKRGEKPDEATIKARKEHAKAKREATDAKIEALLTPEQVAKYAQMKQRTGQRPDRRDHHDRKASRPDKAPEQGQCCNDCKDGCKKEK